MNKTINTKIDLFESLQEYGEFRDTFENYLWETLLDSRNLYGSNLYSICYDLSKQKFTRYEFTNSSEYIPNDDLIYIIDIDGGIWDALYYDYDAVKESLENIGDKIAYSFEEWLEEGVKSDYIENTVDLITIRLKDEIEYEKEEERYYKYLERNGIL